MLILQNSVPAYAAIFPSLGSLSSKNAISGSVAFSATSSKSSDALITQSNNTSATAEDFLNRGIKKGKKGDFQGAIEEFNQAIRLNPYSAKAYNNRGVIYGSLGEPQKAIEDYNQAILLSPNLAQAYHNRGYLYSNQQKWDLALNDYNRAIELAPNFGKAYYNRGIARVQIKDNKGAIEDLQKVAQLFQTQGNTAAGDVVDLLSEYAKIFLIK